MRTDPKKKILYLFPIILLVFIDQFTKRLIVKSFSLYERKTIIDGFFSLTYVQNTGAGFSIMQNATVFLSAVSILAVVFLVYQLIHEKGHAFLKFAYILIISGAIGNLIDRIKLGYVVDFLDFLIFGYDFPVFNAADCFVTVGCAIVILLTVLEERHA